MIHSIERTSAALNPTEQQATTHDTALANGQRAGRRSNHHLLRRLGRRSGQDGRRQPSAGTPEHIGEMRFDALVDDWVAVAGHAATGTFLPPADACPLCPPRGTGSAPTEMPDPATTSWCSRTGFPRCGCRRGSTLSPKRRRSDRLDAAGVGRCEVVCFTSDHDATFADLAGRVRTVIDAWADRTAALSRPAGVEQVFCFENRGQEIGVTLHHPHGQIYAYPYVPPRTGAGCSAGGCGTRPHRATSGADLLAAELAGGDTRS